jgi:hypothetical protein
MKGSKMIKMSDQVTMRDLSWIQRIDRFERGTNRCNLSDRYIVIELKDKDLRPSMGTHRGTDSAIHDVVIQNIGNGAIYLHSRHMLIPCPPVKEVTMADLEEEYGCPIKVIK